MALNEAVFWTTVVGFVASLIIYGLYLLDMKKHKGRSRKPH